MAAGKTKGDKLQLKEKSEFSWRALKKDKLGAVILGCKHHTIVECLKKELFGLPAPHYAYVKNVTSGLTLYLFNYSDRTLHGIFEAVSCGKMNINPLAWITNEGSELTPYPAQVRIREQRKCIPLLETQFKPILRKNYYSDKLFWFELDKEQNKRLMKLFLSSPLPENMRLPEKRSHPPKTANMFMLLSSTDDISDEESKNLHSEEFSKRTELRLTEIEHSSASTNNRDYSSTSDCFDMEQKTKSSPVQRSKLPSVVCQDVVNTDSDSCGVECWEYYDFSEDGVKEIYENKVACLQYHNQESDRLHVTSSENKTSLDGEGELMLSAVDYVLAEKSSVGNGERDHDQPNMTDRDFQSVITKLMQEIQGLKVSQLNQCLKIESLENELVLSRIEIDQLKKSFLKSESKASCASDNCNTKDCLYSYFSTEESVFIVGGCDGHSWLPNLRLFTPNQDHIISLCSMSSTRAYAGMAKLNRELYIFGGTCDVVSDTVESYNPSSNQWIQRPSLKRKTKSPAGASIYDKIYAIGGGNGFEFFSEVESFDLNIGSWTSAPSMLEKRFSPAAADMNGALYVAGGYDGNQFLRSVERFDPRESAWTRVGGMNETRGYHSLVAFKEKLYALGGYNGDTMVSTVEVFDPRIGSWMMGKPMRAARAHFGSFVVEEKMYVLGGVQDDEVLDGMECYEESSSGWKAIGTTALGKISFFYTLVL